jgi:hypothetical protein
MLEVEVAVQRDGLQELVVRAEMVAVEMAVNTLVQQQQESTAQMGLEEEGEVRQNHILRMLLVQGEMVVTESLLFVFLPLTILERHLVAQLLALLALTQLLNLQVMDHTPHRR